MRHPILLALILCACPTAGEDSFRVSVGPSECGRLLITSGDGYATFGEATPETRAEQRRCVLLAPNQSAYVYHPAGEAPAIRLDTVPSAPITFGPCETLPNCPE